MHVGNVTQRGGRGRLFQQLSQSSAPDGCIEVIESMLQLHVRSGLNHHRFSLLIGDGEDYKLPTLYHTNTCIARTKQEQSPIPKPKPKVQITLILRRQRTGVEFSEETIMTGAFILAHDLGTSGNKATLFDAQGRLVDSAFAPVSYTHLTLPTSDLV